MSRELRREIIGCLRVDGSGEENLRNLRNFTPRDWEASLNWLNLSGIALAFWDRLQKSGAQDTVPPRVRVTLSTNLAENRQRVAAMTHEFDSLNRQFERAGIEYAVWKGFALVPHYCPDPCLRPTYDYDYVISAQAWDGAQEVLQSAGYVLRPDPDKQGHLTFVRHYLPPHLSRPTRSLYAVALRRRVELHLGPWDEKVFRIHLRVPDRFLDRKVRRTWQGVSFYSLGEQDTFLFQAVHAFQHILDNWCRLGWLFEIANFLVVRSADASFWEQLYAHLEANEQLREIVALVISLAVRVFHAPSPMSAKVQIPGTVRGAVDLWLDRYGLSAALDNFAENKYSLFLYREFVPDKTAWRAIRSRRLLPLHRPNRVAGSAAPLASAPLPERWRQAWYVVSRLIHHSVSGVRYAWESARWYRLRRARRPLPTGG